MIFPLLLVVQLLGLCRGVGTLLSVLKLAGACGLVPFGKLALARVDARYQILAGQLGTLLDAPRHVQVLLLDVAVDGVGMRFRVVLAEVVREALVHLVLLLLPVEVVERGLHSLLFLQVLLLQLLHRKALRLHRVRGPQLIR